MNSPAQLEQHRVALTGHCYRMLGSAIEADDAVQDSMVRAWKSFDRFDGRSSLRTWLYRIATNVCLDALADRAKRVSPLEESEAGSVDGELRELPRTHWLEPVQDAKAIPADADPAERAILKESVRLAFVAALQHLPPRQRAALLLTEVLGWSAAEVAETLDTTVASVNSAVQRSRATLLARGVSSSTGPAKLSDDQSALLEKYVEAFHRYDVDALTALLREDVNFSMPPYSLWLRGRASVRGWLLGRGSVCSDSRLVPIEACGSPAFAHYHREGDVYAPWAVVVLDLAGGEVSNWTSFLDVKELFPRFGLPLEIRR